MEGAARGGGGPLAGAARVEEAAAGAQHAAAGEAAAAHGSGGARKQLARASRHCSGRRNSRSIPSGGGARVWVAEMGAAGRGDVVGDGGGRDGG